MKRFSFILCKYCVLLGAALLMQGCQWQRKAVVWLKYRGEYPLPKAARNLSDHRAKGRMPTVAETPSKDDAAESQPQYYVTAGTVWPVSEGKQTGLTHPWGRQSKRFVPSLPSPRRVRADADTNRRRPTLFNPTGREPRLSRFAVWGFLSGIGAYAATLITAIQALSTTFFHTPSAGQVFTTGLLTGISVALFVGAIVLSTIYLVRRSKGKTTKGGRGFAIAGLVLGLAPLILLLIAVILNGG